MNTPRILGLALVLSTSLVAAHAQDTLTRDQVRTETQAAQAAGAIAHGDLDISSRTLGADTHPALGATAHETRSQVKAELARAIADGDIQFGDEGRTQAEIDPSRHPRTAQAPALTRAQVRAELAQAIRDGDIEQGDEGQTLAQLYPQRYAAARVRDGETRIASN